MEQKVLEPKEVKEEIQPGEAKEMPQLDPAAKAVVEDLQKLDQEYEEMQAKYDGILEEKRLRNEELKNKLEGLERVPEELLHARKVKAPFVEGQLIHLLPDQMTEAIKNDLESQLEGYEQNLWPPQVWEQHKQTYVQEMQKYLLAVKDASRYANNYGRYNHPASVAGTQVKSLATILKIRPVVAVEYYA